MVKDEIEYSDDVSYQEAVERIILQPKGTHIEFFGGEPTIYPRFLDLLALARQRGHECSIASNLLRFSSKKFTDKVAALGASKIYIRTSIYGDSAASHDYYTAVKGSFEKTVKGIRNIVQAGFKCQINVVILQQNYKQLSSIAQIVHDLKVPRIKFGNLININDCKEHSVSLKDVHPYLDRAIKVSENLGLIVTVEKTPICLASDRIDLISAERFIAKWPRAYDDQGSCADCLVRPWCDGLDPDYANIFGYDCLKPIASVSSKVIKGTFENSLEPEMLKMHCIKIETDNLEEHALIELNNLLNRVREKHGQLAVFPKKYVTE